MEASGLVASVVAQRVPIVCGLLLAVLVAAGPSLLLPPVYQADTAIFVSTRTGAADPDAQLFEGGSFAIDRATSYAELVATPRVLDPVVRQLGLTEGVDDLAPRVSADVPADTVVIDVRARDSSPERTAALTSATAAQLARTIEELESRGDGTPSPVRAVVLRPDEPPVERLWPRPAVDVTGGLVAGLLLAVAVGVLRRRADRAVTGAEDLERATSLPVLAVVGTGGPPSGDHDRHDRAAEPYRMLRTNLRFTAVGDGPGVVAVTSAVPGEGRSAVAAGLALGLHRAGVPVCLLDGDLRHPSVAASFGLSDEFGLTSVLLGRTGADRVVQRSDEGLAVVTTGPLPPNPGDILASDRMRTVLHDLRDRYGTVVVDTAPLLPVADAYAVAARADGTLHVVRAGRTARREVGLALEGLRNVDARVLGTVMVTAGPPPPGRRPRTRTGAGRTTRPG